MQMTRQQRRKYQRLRDFVDGALPATHENRRVYQAYLTWVANGGYTGNEHVSALNALTGPKLIVRQLKGLGKFWPTLPNRVYIDKDLARKFERAKCANAFGRRIVEATILHELIHLYDWKGDRRWMRKGVPNSDNGANEFERAAYGEVVIDRYGDWCT